MKPTHVRCVKSDNLQLTDDPLADLAAVMRHHDLMIDSTRRSIAILQKKERYDICAILCHDLCVLTADDIKPEK